MRKYGISNISLSLIAALMLALLSCPLEAMEENPEAKKASLIGTVYQEDMKTPLRGAVIRIRSFATQKEYTSAPTNETGTYRISNIDPGWYAVGVTCPRGDFNLGYGINLKENETAKLVAYIKPGGLLEKNEVTKKKDFFKSPKGILGVVVLTAAGAFTLLNKKESEVSPIR